MEGLTKSNNTGHAMVPVDWPPPEAASAQFAPPSLDPPNPSQMKIPGLALHRVWTWLMAGRGTTALRFRLQCSNVGSTYLQDRIRERRLSAAAGHRVVCRADKHC